MSRLLIITFARTNDQWEFTLRPEGEAPRGPRRWMQPATPRSLFSAFFGNDRDLVSDDRVWRVRIQPRELPPEPSVDALPAFYGWSCLEHFQDSAHVFQHGWTVAEVNAGGAPCEARDAVAVIAAPGSTLADELAHDLGPRVEVVHAAGSFPDRTVLVVESPLVGKEAAMIQQRAQDANCPLVIWCASAPTAWLPLNEMVTVEAPREPAIHWLRRVLPDVLTEAGPEEALARAARARGAPREDHRARWLRGNFERWKPGAKRDALGFLERWDAMVDRSVQEDELRQLVEVLVAQHSKRRVQVVFSVGPDGADLQRFQARPPLLRSGVEARLRVERVELDWHESPSQQFLRLCRDLDARRESEFLDAVTSRARRCDRQLLLWLAHRPVSLDESPRARQVSLSDLETYAHAMLTAGREFPPNARMLAHISVRTASAAPLTTLRMRPGDHGRADVLQTLTRGVPVEELRRWFETQGLEYADEEVERLSQRSYEDIVRALKHRISSRGEP